MSRMVAFKADTDEEREIVAYCNARHFHSLPDFARMAVFAYIRQNRPGGHRRQSCAEDGDGFAVGRAGGIRPGKNGRHEAEI